MAAAAPSSVGERFYSEDRHKPAAYIVGACDSPWIELPWRISFGTGKATSCRDPGANAVAISKGSSDVRLVIGWRNRSVGARPAWPPSLCRDRRR